jgi:hypothetical protein
MSNPEEVQKQLQLMNNEGGNLETGFEIRLDPSKFSEPNLNEGSVRKRDVKADSKREAIFQK